MVFRRIIFNALLIGIFAGLILSVMQILTVNPIIFAAETYEVEEGHNHAAHDHSEQAWAPEDGSERTTFTIVANIFAGVGFTSVLLALMSQLKMSQLKLQGSARLTYREGVLWGVAGFIAFFVAPGIGLPPEIPGIQAAPIESRQIWWLIAVLGVGIGMFILAYAPMKIKPLGVFSIVLPYIINIPHHNGPTFGHPDPVAVATLSALHQKFIIASGASNLLFWLVLGGVCAWVLNHRVLKGMTTDE